MANKNFEDYGFKPSDVIEALNKWYERQVLHFNVAHPDSKEGARKYHAFYDHDKAIDDVKFKLSTEACNREFGYPDIHSAWPKVNPCFVGPRTERDNEIRDYILKQANAAGIKLPIRDESPEDLIYYLISLLVRNRNNAEAQRERADGYLEKIDRLQKELDGWECWYNDKEHYVK